MLMLVDHCSGSIGQPVRFVLFPRRRRRTINSVDAAALVQDFGKLDGKEVRDAWITNMGNYVGLEGCD
jgi:hypothetical protein